MYTVSSENGSRSHSTSSPSFGQKVNQNFKDSLIDNARTGAYSGTVSGGIAFSEFGPAGIVVGGITGGAMGALGGVLTAGWQAVDKAIFN